MEDGMVRAMRRGVIRRPWTLLALSLIAAAWASAMRSWPLGLIALALLMVGARATYRIAIGAALMLGVALRLTVALYGPVASGVSEITLLTGAPVGATSISYALGRLSYGRRVIVYGPAQTLLAGAHLSVKAPLTRPPTASNPGGFDTALWAQSLGATRVVRLPHDVRVTPGHNVLMSLRRTVMSRTLAAYPKAGPWIVAFTGGGRQALDPLDKAKMAMLSLVHLTAVSGLHAGLWLRPLATKRARRCSARARTAVALTLLLMLYWLSGGASGVGRVTLMTLALTVRRVRGHPLDVCEAAGSAVVAMALIDPFRLLQVGFYQSVSVALVIARVAPRLMARLSAIVAPKVASWMAVAVVAQLAMAPWAVLMNEVTSPLSLIGNLIAALLAPWLTAIALAAVVAVIGHAFVLIPLIDGVMAFIVSLFRTVLTVPVDALWFWPPHDTRVVLMVVIGLWLISAVMRRRWPYANRRIVGTMTALSLIAVGLIGRWGVSWGTIPLSLTQLDVGQGDACVIHLGAGRAYLLDGGGDTKGYKVIWPYMKATGLRVFDLAIASHGHADHIGGLSDLIALGKVRRLAVGRDTLNEKETNRALGRLLQTASRHHVPVITLERNATLRDGALQIHVLPLKPGDDENDRSLPLLITAQGHAMLTMGDLSAAVACGCCRLTLPPIDVLKISHHGAHLGTSERLLACLKPKMAWISVGVNTYGHPASSVLSSLAERRVAVCRTDRDGALRWIVKPDRMEVDTWRSRATP